MDGGTSAMDTGYLNLPSTARFNMSFSNWANIGLISQHVRSRYQSIPISIIYSSTWQKRKWQIWFLQACEVCYVNFFQREKIGTPNESLPWGRKCWRSILLRWWRNLGHQSGMLLMVARGVKEHDTMSAMQWTRNSLPGPMVGYYHLFLASLTVWQFGRY